jgi:arginyl-tRNA synthetase
MPEDAYHGQEIITVAEKLISEIGDKYINVKHDNNGIIENKSVINFFSNFAKNYLLNVIKQDLGSLGISFDI